MTVPCYHCPDRQAGCHAQCAAYRAFRAELDERNAAARLAAAVELACMQCGAPYPALPGSSGLCPACAKKAARTAVCAKCGKPFALPRGGRWPKTCPACRPERHTKGARGPYFGDTAQKPPISAASAEKAPPRRRPKGKGPGGKLGALLADLDKENARRGKKGLPPLSYGKYVQLFGR